MSEKDVFREKEPLGEELPGSGVSGKDTDHVGKGEDLVSLGSGVKDENQLLVEQNAALESFGLMLETMIGCSKRRIESGKKKDASQKIALNESSALELSRIELSEGDVFSVESNIYGNPVLSVTANKDQYSFYFQETETSLKLLQSIESLREFMMALSALCGFRYEALDADSDKPSFKIVAGECAPLLQEGVRISQYSGDERNFLKLLDEKGKPLAWSEDPTVQSNMVGLFPVGHIRSQRELLYLLKVAGTISGLAPHPSYKDGDVFPCTDEDIEGYVFSEGEA